MQGVMNRPSPHNVHTDVSRFPYLSMLMAHRLRMLAVHIITSSVTKMLQYSRPKTQAPPMTCSRHTHTHTQRERERNHISNMR